MSSSSFLPYGRQSIDEADIDAVCQVLQGDWLTTGPWVTAFEEALARETGARFAVVCSNGTAALHLAAMAAGLGPKDWSIVPSVTFLATANAARMVGAEVWFADVDPATGLLRPGDIDAALGAAHGRNVKAVFPVHLNGAVADLEGIAERARAAGLMIIEDACHALGSAYVTASGDVARVGDCRFSDMAAFSFHPVKTVTAGEGGAVTTNSEELARRLRLLRNHGMTREAEGFENEDLAFDRAGEANPWYYEMAEVGYNFRLTDIQCALGLNQLRRLPEFKSVRQGLMREYDERIASLSPRVRPVPRDARCDPCLHLYPVLIDFAEAGVERAEVMRRLHERGIGTQVHYIPVHRQPYYARRYGNLQLPGASTYYNQALSLPFFVGIEADGPQRVVAALAESLQP